MTIKEIRGMYKEQTGNYSTADAVYTMWLEMLLLQHMEIVGSQSVTISDLEKLINYRREA